ncbi:MAG: M56 family metallopeptidase [bacterium]
MVLWRCAVCGLIGIPVLSFLLPAYRVNVSSPAVWPARMPFQEVLWITPPSDFVNRPDPSSISTPLIRNTASAEDEFGTKSTPPDDAQTIIQNLRFLAAPWFWVFTVWGSVALVLGYRCVRTMARVRRLVRDSVPAPEEIQILGRHVAKDLGCARPVRLVGSRAFATPVLYGARHPVIVLPERMVEGGYRRELPGILAHEFVHVKSMDLLWMGVLQISQIGLWFHPLVWGIRAAHDSACEEICDASAAGYVGSPQSYSQTLARVALELYSAPLAPGGITMVRKPEIRKRLEVVMNRLHALPVSKQRLGIFALSAVLVIAAAGVLYPVVEGGAGAASAESDHSQPASKNLTSIRQVLKSPARFSAISTDGKYILFRGDEWNFYELATGNSQTWPFNKIEQPYHNICIAPGNDFLVYSQHVRNVTGYPYGSLNLFDINKKEMTPIINREKINYLPYAFSRDGKRILAVWEDFYEENLDKKLYHADKLGWINVQDGQQTVIKVFNNYEGIQLLFISPNEKYFTYQTGNFEDIVLFNAENNSERNVVPFDKKVQTRLVGWSPDQDWILYTSNRNGSWDLWGIHVVKGMPSDWQEVLVPNIGNIDSCGVSYEGNLYYTCWDVQRNLYVAEFDVIKGIQQPKPIGKYDVGEFIWSSDNQHIAFASSTSSIYRSWSGEELSPQYFDVYSLGDTINMMQINNHDYPNENHLVTWYPGQPALLVYQVSQEGIVKHNLLDDKIEPWLLPSPNQPRKEGHIRHYYCLLTQDGNTMYHDKLVRRVFQKEGSTDQASSEQSYLIRRYVRSGFEKEICDVSYGRFVLSPDEKWLAFYRRDGEQNPFLRKDIFSLLVFNTATEEFRELYTTHDRERTITGWTPDSQSVIVQEGSKLLRVPLAGGEPEEIWNFGDKNVGDVKLSPDGTKIAFILSRLKYEGLWVIENFLPKEIAQGE